MTRLRTSIHRAFAGERFGPGQPLDAGRHFIVLPDALGTGRTARPSDGLRAAFPRDNDDDMVQAQHRLLTAYLGVKHLRVIVGNSMGGMRRSSGCSALRCVACATAARS